MDKKNVVANFELLAGNEFAILCRYAVNDGKIFARQIPYYHLAG